MGTDSGKKEKGGREKKDGVEGKYLHIDIEIRQMRLRHDITVYS